MADERDFKEQDETEKFVDSQEWAIGDLVTLLNKLDGQYDTLNGKIDFLTLQINKMATQFDQFTAAIAQLTSDVTAVQTAFATLTAGLPTDGLTDDQASALVAQIQTINGQLQALTVPTVPPAAGS